MASRDCKSMGHSHWPELSLTPFWNGFAMSISTVDANVGQFGIGFRWH
jgi:hypothetical protein